MVSAKPFQETRDPVNGYIFSYYNMVFNSTEYLDWEKPKRVEKMKWMKGWPCVSRRYRPCNRILAQIETHKVMVAPSYFLLHTFTCPMQR